MIQKFITTACAFLVVAPLAFGQVNVTGTGTVYAKPDCAHLSFVVVTEHKKAMNAHAENAKLSNGFFKVVKAAGVEDKDVSTTNFTISPKYVYHKDEEPKLVGYTVSHHVSVKVRNLDNVGTLIDGNVGDAVRVQGISFAVSDRTALEDKARVLALKDAKKKAGILVEGLDEKLGKLVSVNESVDNPRYQYRSLAAMDSTQRAPGGTTVAAGEQAITVKVNAVWDVAGRIFKKKPKVTAD